MTCDYSMIAILHIPTSRSHSDQWTMPHSSFLSKFIHYGPWDTLSSVCPRGAFVPSAPNLIDNQNHETIGQQGLESCSRGGHWFMDRVGRFVSCIWLKATRVQRTNIKRTWMIGRWSLFEMGRTNSGHHGHHRPGHVNNSPSIVSSRAYWSGAKFRILLRTIGEMCSFTRRHSLLSHLRCVAKFSNDFRFNQWRRSKKWGSLRHEIRAITKLKSRIYLRYERVGQTRPMRSPIIRNCIRPDQVPFSLVKCVGSKSSFFSFFLWSRLSIPKSWVIAEIAKLS